MAKMLYDENGKPVSSLTTEQAAQYLGVSAHTLRRWRRVKQTDGRRRLGPPYCRIHGAIRYRLEDLRRWQFVHLVDPEATR